MNRIYQGRVSNAEIFNPGDKDNPWQPLDNWRDVLWQHHELFQDAINYYTLALASPPFPSIQQAFRDSEHFHSGKPSASGLGNRSNNPFIQIFTPQAGYSLQPLERDSSFSFPYNSNLATLAISQSGGKLMRTYTLQGPGTILLHKEALLTDIGSAGNKKGAAKAPCGSHRSYLAARVARLFPTYRGHPTGFDPETL